jgi:hypothetical protein
MSETPLDDLKKIYPTFIVKNNTSFQQTLNLKNDSVGIMPYSSAEIPSQLFNSFPEKPTFEISNISMEDMIKVGLIKVSKTITNVEPVTASVVIPVAAPVVETPVSVVPAQAAVNPSSNKPQVKE